MSLRPLLRKIAHRHPILTGLATRVPGLLRYIMHGTGGTTTARYCYAVWLRHLVMARRSGLSGQPQAVAELGPGDSLGIGLAALLSGSNSYYAFDIVPYAADRRNLEIFDQLTELFRQQAAIPDPREFPEVKPDLEDYRFPRQILTEQRLQAALQPARLAAIRKALLAPGSGEAAGICLRYFVPWYDPRVIRQESIDMIYSQAVMEHVDDLDHTYQAMYNWLKPGGFLSHEIDFRAHGTAQCWNGHWQYSDFVWRLIKGRRPYLLNRKPHSEHLRLLKQTGFHIVCDMPTSDSTGIRRQAAAPSFRQLPAEDFLTNTAFIQAVRQG